jgi:hypothetical protein
MADTKEFRTRFNIGAVWTGQKGVAQAQRSLGGLQKTAQQAHTHFRGMASSVFKGMVAYGMASKAVEGLTAVLFKSIAAASEAQEAHDELRVSIERMSKRYKNTMGKSVAETSKIVEESTQALIAASEAMEQTGHDAETLQKGWAKLAATGALDPKQILEQRDAFSDVLSYVAGANATAEESQQLGEQWADAILRGNIALLKRMDLSTGEIELVKNVTALEKKGAITGEEAIKRRQALLLKFGKKFEGETKRVFETPTGKIRQMWIQVSNIFENLGQPFVDRAGTMADSFKKIAVEMQPISEKLADIVDVKLKGISEWMEKNGKDIPERLDKFVTALESVWAVLDKIRIVLQTIEDFEFGGLLKLYQAVTGQVPPVRPVQLPGAPSGVVNPALQEGEAGRRNREAQAKKEAEAMKAAPHKYMPYLRELKAQEKAAPGTPASSTPAPAPAPVAPTPAAPTPAAAQQISNAQKAQVLREAQNTRIPATIRHRNPGGMYPGEAANRFGTIGQATIGGGHKIATFPTATHGAAANMWNLANKGYVGKTVGAVMDKWSGGYRGVPGPAGEYPANMKITQAMLNDPNFMIPFMQAVASGEAAGGHKVLSQEQWQQAYDWYQKGGVPNTQMATAPPKLAPGPVAEPKTSQVPVGSSLKDVIKEMTLKQRLARATGATSLSATNNITVNGVAPGREALMAKKTALALRDPVAEGLRQLKEMKAQAARVGYV